MNKVTYLAIAATCATLFVAPLVAEPVQMHLSSQLTWTAHSINDTFGAGVYTSLRYNCVDYLGNGRYFMTQSWTC